MSRFRQRITPEMLAWINDYIADRPEKKVIPVMNSPADTIFRTRENTDTAWSSKAEVSLGCVVMKSKHTSEVDIYASVLAMNLWKKMRLLFDQIIIFPLAPCTCSLFENGTLCRKHYI